MSKHKKGIGKIAVGTTVGALLTAGAAAYFFTQTKTGKQAAKKIKEHAIHLGKEISHRVSKVRNLSKKKYDEIVDEIVDEYANKKKIASAQVVSLKKDLKSHWNDVQKELRQSKTAKPVTPVRKSSTKKGARK